MNAPEPEPSHPRATRPHHPRPPRGGGLRGIRNALPVDWEDQIDLVAIVKLDSGGNIRGWNLGAERIKGYTEAEVLGSHFSRFYREEDRRRGRPDRLLAAAQRDGHVEDTGWRVRRDGQEFWAWVTITAIRSDRGEVLGFVKLVRDLSAERRAEEERATAQRAFAHDLVSPLTALRGYLDLLAEDMPADHHALDAASQVTDHLVAMARSLAASAAATPERTHRRAPLDLIVRGAAALVLPGHAGARLVFGEMSPVVIDGDVLALRRAIANVVENAAKYSDEAITIEVSAKDADAVVVIRDHGRGIHPDDLVAVLEEGVRGRFADSRDGGSGLGLASVQRIIDEHGGTVRIDSVVGEGTTVTLTVPRALG